MGVALHSRATRQALAPSAARGPLSPRRCAHKVAGGVLDGLSQHVLAGGQVPHAQRVLRPGWVGGRVGRTGTGWAAQAGAWGVLSRVALLRVDPWQGRQAGRARPPQKPSPPSRCRSCPRPTQSSCGAGQSGAALQLTPRRHAAAPASSPPVSAACAAPTRRPAARRQAGAGGALTCDLATPQSRPPCKTCGAWPPCFRPAAPPLHGVAIIWRAVNPGQLVGAGAGGFQQMLQLTSQQRQRQRRQAVPPTWNRLVHHVCLAGGRRARGQRAPAVHLQASGARESRDAFEPARWVRRTAQPLYWSTASWPLLGGGALRTAYCCPSSVRV